MGANKTFQTHTSNHPRILGDSPEFRRLRRAVEKAEGDGDRAIRNICRLYGVKALDGLPSAIRAATLALLDSASSRTAILPGSPKRKS
jgi:hypothetical protein